MVGNPFGPLSSPSNHSAHKRPPALLESTYRRELIAFVAEFIGTFLFLFFAFGGTQVANTTSANENAEAVAQGRLSHTITASPSASVVLYIALVFGFSLTVNVWIFFRVSGGLFNPAVTLGLFLIGAVTPIRAALCFLAQMLGGMAAAGVVSAILPLELNVATTLGGGTSIVQGLFLEMFLTAELMFTIYMLAAEKHKATFLAPVGIGLCMFIVELVGVFFTGGSVNPTRSFGPCVVNHSFPGYHWIYWLGPLLGTLLAFAVYKYFKWVEYQTVNPGQDFNDQEAQLFRPPEDPQSAEEVQRPVVR